MGPDQATRRLADDVGELLDGRTLAVAESCTSGLIAQALGAASGSMNWFRGGIVSYQLESKERLLGVKPGPMVTPEMAAQMARGAADRFAADIAISLTGAAGPDPLDGAPPGTVIVGLAIGARTITVQHDLRGSPTEVCEQATRAALADLADELGSSGTLDTRRPLPPRTSLTS